MDREPKLGGLDERPLSSKIFRGSLFSVLQKVVVGPVYLFIVPFTLARVGTSGYGTWAVFVTLITLGSLLDMGLGSTVTKYIAEYNRKGDLRAFQKVLDSTIAMYLFIVGCLCFVLWAGSSVLVSGLFHDLAPEQISRVTSLWPLLFPIMAIDLITRPFLCVISGLQRTDLTQILSCVNSLANALLVVLFLSFGFGIRGLLLATLASSLLLCISVLMVCRQLLPTFRVNPLQCEVATLRKICSFSLALYVGHTMVMIQNNIEKLLLARFVGVVPVGWYSMASEGASKFRRFPQLLLNPVLAAASELHAAEDEEKMRELYFRCHKYMAVMSVPLIVFGALNANRLVSLWVGPKLTLVAVPFVVLMIGNFVNQLGAPAWCITVGRGILRPSVYAALLTSVLNVGLSLIFIAKFGFAGAVVGTSAAMIVSAVYFLKLTRPYVGVPFHLILYRAYLKPLICSLAAAAVMLLPNLLSHREWVVMMIHVAVFGAIYTAGLLLVRFFDRFDLAKAEGHIPFVRSVSTILRTS